MLEIPLLCALLAGLGPVHQDSVQSQENPLDALRRDLLTEGVEARKARERAVGGLLLRKELQAHVILQQALLRPTDPDKLVPFVLDELEKKWAQTEDPVFGNESSLRMELLKSYASVIVRLLPLESRDQRDQQSLALEEMVIACFRDSIRPDERMQVFMYLLVEPTTGKDRDLMSAAMYAAAGCRDMRLVPLIANFLDDAELRVPAQLALQEKIIRPELFADKREFALWWKQNKDRTNIELIEDSARASLAKINEIREGANREQQAWILKVVDYSAKSGDWPELVGILSDPRNKDSLGPCLMKLREARLQDSALSGDPTERIKLVEWLLGFLDRNVNGVRATVLENLAYLVVAEDGASYLKVVRKLHDALFSDQPAESAAAFRGIQRFPSVDNRAQVVSAASASQRNGKASGLLAGLDCLSAQGWQAPGKDDQDFLTWRDLLQDVFEDDKLDHAAKESAIDVACTASDSPETVGRVFNLLLTSVVAKQGQSARVRRYALDNLPALSLEGREDAYLTAVKDLLGDPDVQMRKRAAEVLKDGPFTGFPETIRKVWVQEIIVEAASRLAEEADAGVLEDLVNLMVWMNDQPGGNNVVGRLRKEAKRLSELGVRAENAVLRTQLAKGLAILGGTGGSDLAQWVTAGEALLDLNDRPGLRHVLDTHQIVGLKGSASDEWPSRAFKMVIDAARKRPKDASWNAAEATELEHACSELEALGGLQDGNYDDQELRLLRLAALASRGLHDLVVTKGVAYSGDTRLAFDPGQSAQVRMFIARALLAKGNGPGAEEQLKGITAPGISTQGLPRLWLDVASQYATAKEWDPALRIVAEQFPDQATTLHREAFLLKMECRLGKLPGQKADILKQLQAEAKLFEGDGAADELVKRYRDLLAKASNS